MWVLAAAVFAQTGQPDISAPFLQYSVLGATVLVLGWLHFTMIKDLRAQRDVAQEDARRKTRIAELERENTELRSQLAAIQEDLVDLNREARTQMVPAMVASAQVMTRVVHILDNWRPGGPTS